MTQAGTLEPAQIEESKRDDTNYFSSQQEVSSPYDGSAYQWNQQSPEELKNSKSQSVAPTGSNLANNLFDDGPSEPTLQEYQQVPSSSSLFEPEPKMTLEEKPFAPSQTEKLEVTQNAQMDEPAEQTQAFYDQLAATQEPEDETTMADNGAAANLASGLFDQSPDPLVYTDEAQKQQTTEPASNFAQSFFTEDDGGVQQTNPLFDQQQYQAAESTAALAESTQGTTASLLFDSQTALNQNNQLAVADAEPEKEEEVGANLQDYFGGGGNYQSEAQKDADWAMVEKKEDSGQNVVRSGGGAYAFLDEDNGEEATAVED